ncbi:MAG: hypothetical protein II249_01130 [Bacteroidaceae bacterium]|nr:hypothetical protein [Bacteroidaceae bacterium]
MTPLRGYKGRHAGLHTTAADDTANGYKGGQPLPYGLFPSNHPFLPNKRIATVSYNVI